ncbi:MAG: extracellular solute-binding protein [Ignavibacteria bacterium]
MNIEKLFYIVTSTILVTIFLLFTFVLSSGTYRNNFKNKEKVIFYVDHISSAHKKLIDAFNQKYKGQIRVETVNLSFDKFSTNERKDLLARYLRSKSNRIDIYSVDVIWVARFKKWSIPLTSLIDSNHIKILLPHTLKTCILNDTLYAVPLYTDVALMFYRDDVLRKLPDYKQYQKELEKSITWNKFFELKKKLDKYNRSTKPFYIFQADKYEGLMCSFIEALDNFGGKLLDTAQNLNLDNEATRKAVQSLVDLVNRYKISPKEVSNLRENESYKFFADNDAFAVRGWPSFTSKDNKYIKPELLKNIKKAPTPHIDGSKPVSVFGGWNLMVSKYSEKFPEVIKFIEFLISPEAQKILYEEGGYLPVCKILYEDSDFVSKHPDLIFYKKLFDQGIHRPIDENYTTVSDLISINLSKAIEQNLSAEETIKNILSQYKENVALTK